MRVWILEKSTSPGHWLAVAKYVWVCPPDQKTRDKVKAISKPLCQYRIREYKAV